MEVREVRVAGVDALKGAPLRHNLLTSLEI